MKKKSFFALTAAAFAMTGIVVAGAVALVNHGGFAPYLTKASPKENGSYTLTAANFSNGAGDVVVGDGITWHYNSVAVVGDTVTVSDVMYTSVRSGSTRNGSRRGDGYTRLQFTGLDLTDAVGLVVHETDIDGAVKKGGNEVSADVDLTFGGTVSSEDRRGLHFAQAGGSSFSFTSLTLSYDCTAVSPAVEITTAAPTLDVGENAVLQTATSDVFAGDVTAFNWVSSDTDVATIVGNGATATVTGVADGTATVTVTMSVNGEGAFTDTLLVTVSETPSTPVDVDLGEGSFILGNQVFTYFDTTSTGKTAAQITALPMTAKLEGINNTIASNEIQSVVDNTFRVYSPMANGAVGLSDAFTLTYTFKDSVNHYKYIGVAHYDGGELVPAISLSAASFSVDEGDTLEVTASKASYFTTGTPTFTFQSLDTDVFTVSAVDNVATITGVEEGSANLRVTMNLNGKTYVVEKTIGVTKPGVEHLITWYTAGEGNQRNHWDGAGVWTWVNYGALGYDGYSSFSAKKAEMTVSYESEPSTTIRVENISDDIPAATSCRVYLVAGAAYNTGKLTMTIPSAAGVTHTGTITFVSGEATAYNS